VLGTLLLTPDRLYCALCEGHFVGLLWVVHPADDVCRIIMNLCKMACADPVETPSASAPDPPDESPSDESPLASTTARENGGEAQSQDPNLAAAGIARQVCRALFFHLYDFHALLLSDSPSMMRPLPVF
jgi:hypothetical protein